METSRSPFQVGGTVPVDKLYAPRATDAQLLAALAQGEYCFVLAPRQMGKSSLVLRARLQLQREGAHCVGIDLTTLGSAGLTADEWYFGLVQCVADQLKLADPVDFWVARETASPVQRFLRYLEEQVLGVLSGPVVIFIDELETILSLSFSRDDFIAAVRAMYNRRTEDERWKRLTFCMIGVIALGDLVADAARTPFNVGVSILLQDFTFEETLAFAPGLAELGGAADAWLRAIFDWAEGHPYMTQKICDALQKEGPRGGAPSQKTISNRVASVVERLFLKSGQMDDINLTTAERRFLQEERYVNQMLELYRRLLEKEPIPADGSAVQTALCLTGMVAERPLAPQADRRGSPSLPKPAKGTEGAGKTPGGEGAAASAGASLGRPVDPGFRPGEEANMGWETERPAPAPAAAPAASRGELARPDFGMGVRVSGVGDRHKAWGFLLRPRNAIFEYIFNEAWVREHESDRFLADALASWRKSGRLGGLLLRGEALSRAEEWAERSKDLTADELDFLNRSRKAATEAEAEARVQERIAHKTLQWNRRLWVVSLTALLAGLVAGYQAVQIRENERRYQLLYAEERQKSEQLEALRSIKDELERKASDSRKRADEQYGLYQSERQESEGEGALRRSCERVLGETRDALQKSNQALINAQSAYQVSVGQRRELEATVERLRRELGEQSGLVASTEAELRKVEGRLSSKEAEASGLKESLEGYRSSQQELRTLKRQLTTCEQVRTRPEPRVQTVVDEASPKPVPVEGGQGAARPTQDKTPRGQGASSDVPVSPGQATGRGTSQSKPSAVPSGAALRQTGGTVQRAEGAVEPAKAPSGGDGGRADADMAPQKEGPAGDPAAPQEGAGTPEGPTETPATRERPGGHDG